MDDFDSLTPTPENCFSGTSAMELQEQKTDAGFALVEALKALERAAPHPRDYQFTPTKYEIAIRIHRMRVKKLERLIEELYQEAADILDRE